MLRPAPKPLVSIITPSYNQGRFIEETIESVLSQDYPNIEYIVIDGGSTDESVDIIKKYKDHIACWVSEPDEGISDAFNKGIKASKGEIIGIINVGDRYKTGAIRDIAEALLKNSGYDFVYGDLEFIGEEGKFAFLMKSEENYADKILYTMPAIQHPTVFVRKNVYDTCGLFDTSYKIAMDYEFLLRITKLGKMGLYIDKRLAQMRMGGVSYTRYYSSYEEVCRASIQYGYNPFLAKTRLCLKGFRGLVRVILEVLGLNVIIKVLRRVFWDVRYN